MAQRINPLFIENIFRPVYEANISLAWAAGAVATPAMGFASSGVGGLAFSSIMSGLMAANAVRWGMKASPLLKRHYRLHTNTMTFISETKLRKLHDVEKRFGSEKERQKATRKLYLGDGFKWGNEHSNRAYQIMDFDAEHTDVQLPFALKLLRGKKGKDTTEKLGGSPWIHGIGKEEKQEVDEESLYGHGIIFGNVGTGKTTLLKLLSVGFLHLGNVLICLDPKDDEEWKDVIKRELAWMGMGHRFFHVKPSEPSKSARMALLKRYNRVTEIADRVAPLMGGTGSSKGFQDFAYSIIYSAALGMEFIGAPISLVSIQQSLTPSGKGELARKVFNRYYETVVGSDWKEKLQASLDEYGESRLEQMVNYYFKVLKPEHGQSTPVEKMWELTSHEEGHYQKMVVTLKPVLNALTAAPMDDIFSPKDSWEGTVEGEMEDLSRPMVDFDDLMEHGGALYISLESLSDGQTAGFLSRIIMAEAAAAAGRRYSKSKEPGVEPRRITIMNDEVQASIENNDAMMNLLAMGRAAMFQLILATQTRSDLIAKMANEATANRFLGLTNNFFSMRSTDPATQEYAAKQFNKTSVTTLQAQTSQNTDSGKGLGDFSSSRGTRAMKAREDAFPEPLLGDLPKLQYICKLADGRKLKMRLPIYTNQTQPNERAPWVIGEYRYV
ncbi:conjugative transfer system coupling protein TraD [Aliidiomarina quisquiliarum]|uniref:conjugative transfer system coupling protein TraD n=1 Tax=Aliidiomarina quisquiliarum TaxID=2938947 RepID=UPI00208FC3EA|nr:conjugative transfer system coupling protein TraD [Aliidiomarina quisquiliarum]MCO4319912.1 conjugative transfer system coupling protein TraD [Aliidiomarina quisquiliarum]